MFWLCISPGRVSDREGEKQLNSEKNVGLLTLPLERIALVILRVESIALIHRAAIFQTECLCAIGVLRSFQQSLRHITMAAACFMRHDNARILSATCTYH